MFAILTRPLARRVVVRSYRYMSQKPSSPPSNGIGQTPLSESLDADRAKQTPESTDGARQTGVEAESILDTRSQNAPTLDFSPPEVGKEFQRTGARSSKGSLSSSEKKRRFLGRVSLALLLMGFGAHTAYMGREWEDAELREMRMRREDALSTRWGRTKQRYREMFDYLNKPAWPDLLPPPHPPPHQKPYTLLLSIDDLLVTSTWDRQHGWRTAKRPGVDYFLAYISQFYEVVVFTTQPSYTAGPILEKLDRYGFFINHRLFREATRSIDGKIVKDLSYLNRDLSKVILLDTHPEHVSTHPENSVVIPKWTGDPKDKGLVAMIPFLESIAIYKPPDVRPVLNAYEGKNVPLEYGKLEAEMKAKHIDEWKSKHKRVASIPTFGSLFGMSSSPTTTGPPPTYLEQKRAESQKQYLEEQKYLRDNKAELEKLLEQDHKAMAAQVPNNLWEAIDHFRGVAPQPPPPGAPSPAGASTAPGGNVGDGTPALGSDQIPKNT